MWRKPISQHPGLGPGLHLANIAAWGTTRLRRPLEKCAWGTTRLRRPLEKCACEVRTYLVLVTNSLFFTYGAILVTFGWPLPQLC